MKKILLISIIGFVISFPIRKLLTTSQLPKYHSQLYSATEKNPIADLILGLPKEPWLRKIWMGKIDQLLQYIDPTIDNNAALKAAIMRKDEEIIRLLFKDERVKNLILTYRRHVLEHDINPGSPFEKACAEGNSNYILPHLLLTDFKIDSSTIARGLEIASKRGQLDIVKLLINFVDPYSWDDNADNCPVLLAAAAGYSSILSVLLKRLDPSCGDHIALFMAAFNGHLGAVDILLRDHRIDPTANQNSAFLVACYVGNSKVVDRFLQDDRVVPPLMGLKDAFDGEHYDIVESICRRLGLDPNLPESWN
jgi:ankyrin repeat protein